MSVSGSTGVGGAGFEVDPAGTDEPVAAEDVGESTISRFPTSIRPAADPEAEALSARLQEMADDHEAWLPEAWSWIDSSRNVETLANTVLADGHVSAEDVETLVGGAFDWGEIQPKEKDALVKLVQENASKFDPSALTALSGFLGIERPGGGGEAIDLGLPEVGGKSFAIDPRGFPVEKGSTQGPPGMRGEGAERIYRAGKAIVEGPAGVLGGVPAEVQERMLQNASAWYDAGLAEVASSAVSPTDANKVRSGAAATLLGLVEGGATDEIRNQAAAALLARGQLEPVEGLRANIFVNLDALKDEISPDHELRTELSLLKETVLPSKPPYDEWFKDGNETFEVVHYAHHECWEHATDPITVYKREGMEVKDQGTNPQGEQFWVLEGKIKGGDGSEQQTRIKVLKSHDEFCRDLDDPDVHAVIYSGHSNLGGNVSEAIRRGPQENGKKLLSFQLCRGQQNLFEVVNKYPSAHLSTSMDPSYFSNMMPIALGTLKGVARRDTYEGINDSTRMNYRAEKITNYIRPNELRRFEFTDMDLDGQPELGLDSRDRFFDVLTREPDLHRTDLVMRDEPRPASEIDATAVMSGANFARTLITYHVEKSPGDSPIKNIPGDRIEAAGYFEGSDDPVRIEESVGRDGKPVYNVSVNKGLSDQSAYAIGGLVQYEFVRHFAEKDGTFDPGEKARALLMTGTYLAYMYCSASESDSIMRAVGDRAGVSGLSFQKVYAAIDADDHGYVTDGQAEALLNTVNIR